MGYKTFTLQSPESNTWVSGYSLRVESNEHKIILDGLKLIPNGDISCVELAGIDQSSTSTKVQPAHLTIALLDQTTCGDNVFKNTRNSIFNMRSSSSAKEGNMLEFVGVREYLTYYGTLAGGKLTLQGGHSAIPTTAT